MSSFKGRVQRSLFTAVQSKLLICLSILSSYSSGKSYLLRGEDAREKGLILHAIDELLKLVQLSKQSQTQETETKSFRLFCSMFFVHHDKRVDLIQRSSIPYEVIQCSGTGKVKYDLETKHR